MAVPKLRFKADNGSNYPELTVAKLDDLCEKIGDGLHGTPIYSQTGNYYFINGNNLENGKIIVSSDTPKVNDSVFEKNNKELNDSTILMSINGTIGKVAYYNNEKVMLGKSVAYFKVNYKCIKEYCYQLIQTANVQCQFQKGLTGSTIKNLGLNTIKNTNVKVPCLPEQQKIAEFLSTIDTVIAKQKETVSAWEERKKGVMQKLFSQKVRFKADDGSDFPEWEEKKLSEMFKKVIEKNRLDLPPLTIIQGYGTIRRDESERRIAYDEKGLKNYKAVQKDDFIVHLRSFEGGLEIANQDGIVSPAYHVYRGNDEVHPSFYYPYFRSSSFIKGKLAICVTGVRDGKNIEMRSFDELLIPVPCLEEQQKIADCLSSLDEVIEKQKATLAAWEELKKGLLQQMFV